MRVVDERGFSSAARALGLSTSYVSRQLSALESRLGVRLLNRSTRRQSLTPVGALFYRNCSSILAQLEEAELAVTQLQTVPRGLLRISAPVTFGERFVAPVLAQFMADHEQLEVELQLEDRDVDPNEGGFDLVIRAGMGANGGPGLLDHHICPMRRVLVARPEYLHERGVPHDLNELEGHATLALSSSNTDAVWDLEAHGVPVKQAVTPEFQASSKRALRLACLAGRGIAFLPDWLVGIDLKHGHLEQVLPHVSGPTPGVFAVYPEHKHLSARVRLFVACMANSFTEGPDWAIDPLPSPNDEPPTDHP